MRAFILRSCVGCFLLVFLASATHIALAQRKAEGEKKLPEKAVADQNPATPSDETLKEEEKEDPLFKGMKYRIVGPFRGGRSLYRSRSRWRPEHLLFRRYWRRRMEVYRRRDDVEVGVR